MAHKKKGKKGRDKGGAATAGQRAKTAREGAPALPPETPKSLDQGEETRRAGEKPASTAVQAASDLGQRFSPAEQAAVESGRELADGMLNATGAGDGAESGSDRPVAAMREEDTAEEKGRGGATPSAVKRSLLRSAALVSSFTLLSRLLGLIRDRVFAHLFGASAAFDAFVLAFMVPNLFRRLFGEGALSAAFLPTFMERLEKGDREGAFRIAGTVMGRLGVLLLLLSFAGSGVGLILSWLLPATSEWRLVFGLVAVIMPYVFLINLAAVLMAVLHGYRHFATSAVAPVLLNLVLIAAAWLVAPLFGNRQEQQVYALAWAVLAGGMLQLLIQVPPALRRGFRFRLTFSAAEPGYQEVKAALLPVLVGLGIFQVNVLVDRLIAKMLLPADGAVTELFLGNRLLQLPLALFAVAMATAALPALSSLWARQDFSGFRRMALAAFRQNLFLALPATAAMCLLADPLVHLLFGSGEFARDALDPEGAVGRTARVVVLYSLGLPFYSLNTILSRMLYATRDTRGPMRAGLVAVVVNLALNVSFVLAFPALGSGALALASSVAALVQMLVLLRLLVAAIGPLNWTAAFRFTSWMLLPLALSGAVAFTCWDRLEHGVFFWKNPAYGPLGFSAPPEAAVLRRSASDALAEWEWQVKTAFPKDGKERWERIIAQLSAHPRENAEKACVELQLLPEERWRQLLPGIKRPDVLVRDPHSGQVILDPDYAENTKGFLALIVAGVVFAAPVVWALGRWLKAQPKEAGALPPAASFMASLLGTLLSAGMAGVAIHQTLYSVAAIGSDWTTIAERALAPLFVGGVVYWFMVGQLGLEEHEAVKSALGLRLKGRRKKKAPRPGDEKNGRAGLAPPK